MITDLLYDRAAERPEAPLLRYLDRTITYGEMTDLVSAFARRLSAAGVGRGHTVVLLCGNRPGFLVAWFALTELGAIAVPLNTALVGDGLRYTLDQSEASALLIEPELLENKRVHLPDHLPKLMVTLIDEGIEIAAERGASRHRSPDLSPSDANSILYTSGTTGLPKGAVISSQCYLQAGADMAASLGVESDDRILLFLPLFHANPQMYGVMSVLQEGASIALLPKFSASEFFEDARRAGATGFTFVGTVLSILAKRHPGVENDHGLKWGVGGGAPLLVWKDIEARFGIRIHELYGMTETGGWVSMNTPGRTRHGSVGWPREGVELAIVDEHGERQPAGTKGEIIARSARPRLFFEEYWRKPEITAATVREGWLHTGDRGFLDEDGYLYFDGRVKELIRRGGEMVSPVEVELQLLKHPYVRDCGVFAVPDEILGEEITAAVVTSEDLHPSELKSFLAERLPKHMAPRYIVFVDAISRTETEKIKRHELPKLSGPVVDLHAS